MLRRLVGKLIVPITRCHDAYLLRVYYGGHGGELSAEESYFFEHLCNATLHREDILVAESIM